MSSKSGRETKFFDCDECGESVKVYPSHQDQDHHFCSRECSTKFRTKSREARCDNCGDSIRVQPCREDLDHHFCGKKCSSEFKKTAKEVPCEHCGELVEKNVCELEKHDNAYCSQECHYNDKDGEQYECEHCGESVYRLPSDKMDRVFCSQDCFYEVNQGKDHGNWKRVEVTCWWCESTVVKKKDRAERATRHFCDYDCMSNWNSWNNVHPQDTTPDKGGPKWEWDRDVQNTSQPPNVSEMKDTYQN